MENKNDKSNEKIDIGKRNFLKFLLAAGTVVAVGGALEPVFKYALSYEKTGLTSFPKIKVANINDLQVNQPITFNYPLENEPNYLVKLGQPAEGGIGPNNDIVAFSAICEHMGCIYHFETSLKPYGGPNVPGGHCPCHGSLYDYLEKAKVVGGPAPCPVPMVQLVLDSTTGDIYAVGMNPPTIYDHGTPCGTDVTADLTGGTPVSS